MLPLRAGAFGLLLAFGLACNKGEPAVGVDSPNAAGAGAERDAGRAGGSGLGEGSRHGRGPLVSVARLEAAEAEPCERTCGRVGDCLLAEPDVGAFDAGRLELECLDVCVHSPKDAAPRSTFLGCERQGSCGELLGCARSSWQPLVALRQSPAVEGIIAKGDPCKEGCRWLFSCIATGAPPGEAYLSPEYEENVRFCESQCEIYGPEEREVYARLAECLPSHCDPGRFDQCFAY